MSHIGAEGEQGISEVEAHQRFVSQVVEGTRVTGASPKPVISELLDDPGNPKSGPTTLVNVYSGTNPWPFAYTTPDAQHEPPVLLTENGRRVVPPGSVSMIIQHGVERQKNFTTFMAIGPNLLEVARTDKASGTIYLAGVKKGADTVWQNAKRAAVQHNQKALSKRG
jgi:hypothetical protein